MCASQASCGFPPCIFMLGPSGCHWMDGYLYQLQSIKDKIHSIKCWEMKHIKDPSLMYLNTTKVFQHLQENIWGFLPKATEAITQKEDYPILLVVIILAKLQEIIFLWQNPINGYCSSNKSEQSLFKDHKNECTVY